ncbi:MAG: hypothetical protein WDO15_03420 [Bacteroidota bacterium]
MFGRDLSVTGVSEDVPENSHFSYDFMFYWGDEDQNGEVFTSFEVHTYLLLQPDADPKALEGEISREW